MLTHEHTDHERTHMPTRVQMRAQIKTRLEDLGAGVLWDDQTINDAIVAALLRYGARMPSQQTLPLDLPAGATSYPIPTPPGDPDGIDPARIVRVLDERGDVVPRSRPVPDGPDTGGPTQATLFGGVAQGWRVWDGALLLERPARGGEWRIEHLGPRTAPAEDEAALDLLPGDEEAVAELAIGLLLRRRMVEEAKRGITTNAALAREIDRAESAARMLLDRRRRTATGGWLT
jgi:hypothetical protein